MADRPFSTQVIIADLLRDRPETIPVFLAYKMGCVGCSMAPFETLADAIAIYRLPRQQFLEDLERAIKAKDSGDK